MYLSVYNSSTMLKTNQLKDLNLPPPAVASVLSAPQYVSAAQPVVGACVPRSAAAPAVDVGSALNAPY